jgi:hypothetical protein
MEMEIRVTRLCTKDKPLRPCPSLAVSDPVDAAERREEGSKG